MHRKLDVLNGQRYFSNIQEDARCLSSHPARELSTVRAGTVVIKDTPGMRRANLFSASHRDHDSAVFVPLRAFYRHRN